MYIYTETENTMKVPYSKYKKALADLAEKSNMRILPTIVASNIYNLSSNDYLGLMSNPELGERFMKEYPDSLWKFSSSSSRLLTGNSKPYQDLEACVARTFGREACLVFNSGYHANIGILPALTSKRDLIVADKLIHASLIDGIKLSQAEFKRYNHLDYVQLEQILETGRDLYEHIFIVSESIYSMDGDKCDLQKLVALKKKYDCYLYIDEAHAIGVNGDIGLGLAEEQNCINDIDFIIGTFGKALASYGAYIVCDEVIKQYLINTARSMIFTTALPPFNVAWTHFIFNQIETFKPLRDNLVVLSKAFGDGIKIPQQSHIVPYVLGENEKAVQCSTYLHEHGFLVLPIRHPTVPIGTARLRFSLSANLTTDIIYKVTDLLNAFEKK